MLDLSAACVQCSLPDAPSNVGANFNGFLWGCHIFASDCDNALALTQAAEFSVWVQYKNVSDVRQMMSSNCSFESDTNVAGVMSKARQNSDSQGCKTGMESATHIKRPTCCPSWCAQFRSCRPNSFLCQLVGHPTLCMLRLAALLRLKKKVINVQSSAVQGEKELWQMGTAPRGSTMQR